MKKIITTLSLLLFFLSSFAQDINFSHYSRSRLYNNPAYAGFSDYPELNVNYRKQWPGLSNSNQGTYIGYDFSIDKINSGFGIYSLLNNTNHFTFHRDINIQYSYRINISKKFSIQPGIGFGINNTFIDVSKMTSNDIAFNPKTGLWIDPALGDVYYANLDASFGLLFRIKKFSSAVAFSHFNESALFHDAAYFKYNNPKFHLFGSYVFGLTKKIKFIPSVIYMKQQSFVQMHYKFDLLLNRLALGIHYGHTSVNSTSVSLSAAYYFKRFGVLYTHGFNMSDVIVGIKSSGELGVYFRPSIRVNRKSGYGLGLF
ncbi:MAG: PorP/SprF family type IX secretion system membrane protein [Bacteroidetes bacterium]|jgi:type IX secretion system PorP/SprF family membrane protein|nr:PorP/SprF family type IX secretion system membrane protein [Bacteroidota bacterium]MBT3801630.1 PorP/SprF family type IX secretion system membrane protein [Bacteroidota bacterium]MBT4729916.1 PorP/SprF family type IX secretion system membrane protein [Bacteroidota bacterium]MBT4970325.1 PorP/SprF family type IX secretion system membrane protein [Bacteroidota bacterium]MBT6837925.1 PorP/SprF family type IX secretion system membrane protein [Bacteroidota bacterium]